jgi:hypothetical protein
LAGFGYHKNGKINGSIYSIVAGKYSGYILRRFLTIFLDINFCPAALR